METFSKEKRRNSVHIATNPNKQWCRPAERWRWLNRIPTWLTLSLILVLGCLSLSQRKSSVYQDGTPSYAFQQGRLNWSYVASVSPDVRVKAGLVALAREEDLYRLRSAMRDVELRFNKDRGYPWIILNDVPLSEHFKNLIVDMTTAPVYFGVISDSEWREPSWISPARIKFTEELMNALNFRHGNNLGWRRMARYNTGWIARHPLLQDLDYYWKVQPESNILCDMDHDPFEFMQNNGKKLAFTVTMGEEMATISGFWSVVQDYIIAHQNELVPPQDSIFHWIVDRDNAGKASRRTELGAHWGDFNACHIWNNFQIVSLDYLRSPAYLRFFNHLDRSGGFFYERWSDAVAQTAAAALFLRADEIHFMNSMGYFFSVAGHCPNDADVRQQLKCSCLPTDFYAESNMWCTNQFLRSY